MNQPILFTLVAAAALVGSTVSADAKSKHHDRGHGHDYRDYERHESGRGNWGKHRDRTRTIYVIEHNRPVRRVVYVSPVGGYYRLVDGRRVSVRGRTYSSYPSKYYYPDGRRRLNVSFSF